MSINHPSFSPSLTAATIDLLARLITRAKCPKIDMVLAGCSILLTLLILIDCGRPSANEVRFNELLAGQLARYPQMQVQDLYKFIYQAALGSEHAVYDLPTARRQLARELATLRYAPITEPLSDTLSPDGRLVRIHLRPYLSRGGNPDALVAAFVRTASEFRGKTAVLKRYWSYAEAMAKDDELPFTPGELKAFFAEMRSQGFPAVHHSEPYRTAYHPAYRVILREYLDLP
ncbi:MAG: hypothetical protein ACETWG_04420 [Candidatus Neomarinimicrobiota bacterium]